MKYCQKCGKELLDEAVICVGCGCSIAPIVTEENAFVSEEEILEKAENVIAKSKMFPIISLALWVIAVVVYLFVHTLVGVVILCVAAICTFVISIKLNSVFNTANIQKSKKKELTSKLQKDNNFLKLNRIVTVVIGVSLILSGIGFGVIDSIKSKISYKYESMYDGSYGYGFIQQLDEWDDIYDYSNYMENLQNKLGW